MSAPDPVRAIADAVLYEGYVLWPYRRSALKNQRRFTFGGVYPPAHSAEHPDDPCRTQTEVLLHGSPETRLSVSVRFLQVVRREVLDADGRPIDELVVGGDRHLSWEEAVEREIAAPTVALGELTHGVAAAIAIEAGDQIEDLGAGAVRRSWRGLDGALTVTGAEVGPGLWRVRTAVENRTPVRPGSRQEALAHTFCSTHTLLSAGGGAFVSAADPPSDLADAAAACENVGCWPVPVGEPGDMTTMLASPIILEDHPRIAPESPGDLFDGGEIDELLILNILTLTGEEKAEMAASDPRAREILRRSEALTQEQLMSLHGMVRETGLA